MALLIGPLTRPQSAQEAIAEAFVGQVALEPHHVRLTAFQVPDESGVEAWRWELVTGAPGILDLGAARFVMNAGGRVAFPAGEAAHPRIDRGVVLWIEDVGGFVLVAADDQGGDDHELAMLGIDHVDQWLAGKVPELRSC